MSISAMALLARAIAATLVARSPSTSRCCRLSSSHRSRGDKAAFEETFKVLGFPLEHLDLPVLGDDQLLQSRDLFLGLTPALAEDFPLVLQIVVLRRKDIALSGHRVLCRRRGVCQQGRIELDHGLVVPLGPQTRGQRLARCDPVLDQIELRPRLRAVELDENLARLDDIAIGGVQIGDDAALQMLDELAGRRPP